MTTGTSKDLITTDDQEKELETQLDLLTSRELMSKLILEITKAQLSNHKVEDDLKYSTGIFYRIKSNEYERYKKIMTNHNNQTKDKITIIKASNAKTINEINRVTEEKIETVHEKDNLELLIEKYKNKRKTNTSSIYRTTQVPSSLFGKSSSEILETQCSVMTTTQNSVNTITSLDKKEKIKKIKELQKQISNFSKMMANAKKNFNDIHKKNLAIIEDNQSLIETLQQKQILLENIRKEIELLKHIRHGRTPSFTTQENSCYSNSTKTTTLPSNKSNKGIANLFKGMFNKK